MQRSAIKKSFQKDVKLRSDKAHSESKFRKRHSKSRTSHFSWTYAIALAVVGLLIGLLKISPLKELADHAVARILSSSSAVTSQPQAFLRLHETLGCKSEQEDFNMLLKSLEDAGAYVSNVNISYMTTSRRGLVVTAPVTQGSPILSVPLELSLSASTFLGRGRLQTATKKWWGLGVPDIDQLMDPLALISELLLRGKASPWARYMCTLPNTTAAYNLPFSYKDKWSRRAIEHLPGLRRLNIQRISAVQQYFGLIREALRLMPESTALLQNILRTDKGKELLEGAFYWAYAASKTRTVTLDLEEAERAGATLLVRHEETQGPKGNALGNLREEALLPASVNRHMSELGVMVPVFDMANHASSMHATAALVVHFKRRDASLYAKQQLVEQHEGSKQPNDIMSQLPGVGVEFSLVAVRDLTAGEEVTFSYNPNDDEQPSCNERWLIEYGFLLQDGKSERNCHTWNLTVVDVLAVLNSPPVHRQQWSSSTNYAWTQPSTHMIEAAVTRLRNVGLNDWHTAMLDGSGTVHTSLVKWISAAVGNPAVPEKFLEGLPAGVEVQEAWTLRVLCRLVHRQHFDLEAAAKTLSESLKHEALGSDSREAVETVTWPGYSQATSNNVLRAHQEMLLSLFKGSVMASRATLERLNSFCR
ncbi:hypothetical protein CEUSTIGMA_g2265.t1 [Chlamydomonas eustigma]|uniref:SET domain-containing protein n=1 Tax=Chlamydomonas eustigma TaxID=1157962 RepID=A0A250WVG9_9CHLO|nr:hypothetical protein CEUSTIGMA_g2265.t1 [Chlamydomonas eustigma]|eukprot:GAX74818.1 hypothetical protein CEUSTIGMA_g2265.t1 [Chlamydomonas eustigma]